MLIKQSVKYVSLRFSLTRIFQNKGNIVDSSIYDKIFIKKYDLLVE